MQLWVSNGTHQERACGSTGLRSSVLGSIAAESKSGACTPWIREHRMDLKVGFQLWARKKQLRKQQVLPISKESNKCWNNFTQKNDDSKTSDSLSKIIPAECRTHWCPWDCWWLQWLNWPLRRRPLCPGPRPQGSCFVLRDSNTPVISTKDIFNDFNSETCGILWIPILMDPPICSSNGANKKHGNTWKSWTSFSKKCNVFRASASSKI